MQVKQLKEAIKNLSDDTPIMLVGYNHKTGSTTLQHTYQCCNTEHQEKNNQLWLSMEGLRAN